MIVEIAYCCPTAVFGEQHFNLAAEFAETLFKFEAGFPYKFTVISNGGTPDTKTEALFAPFNPHFFVRANIAKDLGAFQHVASQSNADLMVFLGGSTYIRGNNWLLRIAESFGKHGNGLYGSMSNSGDYRVEVAPHIRTTGFWMPPKLMNAYPERVVREEQRYPFEHGPNCLTSWVAKQGLPVMTVTWTHEWPLGTWEKIPDGFHRGRQEGLILGDHLSKIPFYPHP